MNARLDLRSRALPCALALGILADLIVRVDGRPGINITLWALAGIAVLLFMLQRRSDPVSGETKALVGGAFAFACLLAVRDAEALAVFSLFAAVALLMLAAGRAAAAWAARAHVSDVGFSVMRVALLCAAGPLGWGRGVPDAAAGKSSWSRRARTVARGALIALPALLVLGALLMSADEVFARMIQNTFRVDIESVMQHVVFSAVITWIAAGYLRAFMVNDDVVVAKLRVPQPSIATAEITVALWILNLLFIVFMAVQVRYLFGGAGLVEVTAGLTYAEYARKGFFELIATAALVVPILLAADWAAAVDDTPRSVLRASALVLIVLLMGVIASAAYRMHLYQDAYGLTEDRLYVTVFISWLVAVLVWLVLTVLRGKRERFAFGAIVAGVACIAALHVLNPHALIARVNLARAAAGREYDGKYLRTLSADAVPTILARMDRLPAPERCAASQMLVKRWGGERPGGWRTWNYSDARARRLVASVQTPSGCS